MQEIMPAGFRRVSDLLDFESASDLLFVSSGGKPIERGEERVRSGKQSLHLTAGTRRVVIKLSGLLSGREFPGGWTLAGVYLYCPDEVEVTARIESGGISRVQRKLKVPANRWTPVMLDVAAAKPMLAGKDHLELVLEFAAPLAQDAWCDDVLLADNRQTLVSTSEGVGDEHWSIRREGYNWIIERPARFRILLPTEALAGGWKVEEANRIRACFRSEGDTKHLTVYCDGRSYWDGAYKTVDAMDGGMAYAGSHLRPGEMTVPEEEGRVERNREGDRNHDGYDEGLGAYEVAAAGRRVEVTLTPRGTTILRPVLEIRGLPAGDVRATIEGMLAGDVLRLADGRVLIVLSGEIQRRTVVDVRVR